jgi:hypothetical protein
MIIEAAARRLREIETELPAGPSTVRHAAYVERGNFGADSSPQGCGMAAHGNALGRGRFFGDFAA